MDHHPRPPERHDNRGRAAFRCARNWGGGSVVSGVRSEDARQRSSARNPSPSKGWIAPPTFHRCAGTLLGGPSGVLQSCPRQRREIRGRDHSICRAFDSRIYCTVADTPGPANSARTLTRIFGKDSRQSRSGGDRSGSRTRSRHRAGGLSKRMARTIEYSGVKWGVDPC